MLHGPPFPPPCIICNVVLSSVFCLTVSLSTGRSHHSRQRWTTTKRIPVRSRVGLRPFPLQLPAPVPVSGPWQRRCWLGLLVFINASAPDDATQVPDRPVETRQSSTPPEPVISVWLHVSSSLWETTNTGTCPISDHEIHGIIPSTVDRRKGSSENTLPNLPVAVRLPTTPVP